MTTTLEARGTQTIDRLSSLEDETQSTHGLGSDYQPAESGAERRTITQQQDERTETPTSHPQVESTTATNSVPPLTGEHVIFVGHTPHGATIIKKPRNPGLAEIAEWDLRTGFGVLTLTASLGTALVLTFVMGKDISTAFTMVAWVLVAGTMLAVTTKACLWGRLKLRRDDNVPLQSSIFTASYPP